MAYNVTTDFGANSLVGDGSTDSTAKLNAIFGGTSTPALTAPYTLYFPAGTYKFSSTPSAVPSSVVIYGDGTGQVAGLTYRCGNFGAQGVFAFARSAAPTGLARLGTATIPFTSTQVVGGVTTVAS